MFNMFLSAYDCCVLHERAFNCPDGKYSFAFADEFQYHYYLGFIIFF